MSGTSRDWKWSDEHQNYYYHEWNGRSGSYDLIWAERETPQQRQHRSDSGAGAQYYPAFKPSQAGTPSLEYEQPALTPPVPDPGAAQYNIAYSQPLPSTQPYQQSSYSQTQHHSNSGYSSIPAYSWQTQNYSSDYAAEQTPRPSHAFPYRATYNYGQSNSQSYGQSNPPYAASNSTTTGDFTPSMRTGLPLEGRYGRTSGNPNEELDQSYSVRHGDWFREGKVFSVLFSEASGETAPTTYNSTISRTFLGGSAHTQIRRFIVTISRREYCYACPIFTYGGRATLKPGVRANEHAIVYSSGEQPSLLNGESGLKPHPICVEDAPNVRPMNRASRIYFGIHHPIQFNLRVKDLGKVSRDSLRYLRGYFREEYIKGVPMQDLETTADQTDTDDDD